MMTNLCATHGMWVPDVGCPKCLKAENERLRAENTDLTRYKAEAQKILLADGTSDEPTTKPTACRYCLHPMRLDGSILHAGGCAGLDTIKLNRLEYDALKGALRSK